MNTKLTCDYNNFIIYRYRYLFLITLLVFFSFNAFSAVDDTQAPEVVSVNLAPTSIDVTSTDANVTFTAHITDDLSGLNYAYFYLRNADKSQTKYVYLSSYYRISGTAQDGVYQTTISFPQFSQAGNWTLDYAYVYDVTSNQRYYSETELSGLGDVIVAVTSVPDTTSPVITSSSITPNSIDVSGGDANITLELNITDDNAGFDYAEIWFGSSTSNQYKYEYVWDSDRIAGDSFGGTYSKTISFPQYSAAGEWYISYIYLYDKAGNRWYHSSTDLVGLTTTFTMVADPQDISAPEITALNVSPTVVNTIDGSDDAVFSVGIDDNLSGFNYGWIYAYSESGNQRQYRYFNQQFYLTSGDALSGQYDVTLTFPRYSEFGEWTVGPIYLYDRTTNYTSYNNSQLQGLGFPTVIKMEGIKYDGSGNYTVGPDGGTIETNDGGLTMEVPNGALPGDTEISVTSVGRFEPVDILVNGEPSTGNSLAEYNFEPDGLTFDEPVTVKITVDVTGLNQNQRDRLTVFLLNEETGRYEPIEVSSVTSITDEQSNVVSMVFEIQLVHFSTYAVIEPIVDTSDNEAPTVEIAIPEENASIQDYATFNVQVTDASDVASVSFTIREANGNGGNIIGHEDISATQQGDSDIWELGFDSTALVDGNYIVYAKATDAYDNEGTSSVVPFTIRNWAIVRLLPASEDNKAGRTMPIKFALRVDESVDHNMPFVWNENLEIRVYKTSEPGNVLQTSTFGTKSTDYRINSLSELYITNFKTDKEPAIYRVEIWRPANNFMIDSFDFQTIK